MSEPTVHTRKVNRPLSWGRCRGRTVRLLARGGWTFCRSPAMRRSWCPVRGGGSGRSVDRGGRVWDPGGGSAGPHGGCGVGRSARVRRSASLTTVIGRLRCAVGQFVDGEVDFLRGPARCPCDGCRLPAEVCVLSADNTRAAGSRRPPPRGNWPVRAAGPRGQARRPRSGRALEGRRQRLSGFVGACRGVECGRSSAPLALAGVWGRRPRVLARGRGRGTAGDLCGPRP